MENLQINLTRYTLVDQVEEKLIEYFKEQNLTLGSSIPNENELAAALGIGRTVLREALSRFKMIGMIESRTKRGMTLAEPSIFSSLKRCMNPLLMTEATIKNIFEFRIILEMGCTKALFARINGNNIKELEKVVELEEISGVPHPSHSRNDFHQKVHEIIDNKMISEFQRTIIPVLEYATRKQDEHHGTAAGKQNGKINPVTHRDLLDHIKEGNMAGYEDAIEKHFAVYDDYLR